MMNKKEFNKLIKTQMLSNGFQQAGTYDYWILCADKVTKLVVGVPDYQRGFHIGAQFLDYGSFSGTLKECSAFYYEYEVLLNGACVNEYSEEDIYQAICEVVNGLEGYIVGGKEAIGKNVDKWCISPFDHQKRNAILQCIGLPPIDPYSEAYFDETIQLIGNGGGILLPYAEYREHESYYNKFKEHGFQIIVPSDTTNAKVRIYKFT